MSHPDEKLPLVQMRRICKSFGPVQVLFDIDLDLYPGEVHILLGENGAGKSTLVKVLAGVFTDYAGTIQLGGRFVRPTTPQESAKLGIAMIYQELSLVPYLSVAENLFVGRLPVIPGGWLWPGWQKKFAMRLLEQVGLNIDVRSTVADLPIAVQQLVEIAKALGRNARVIIMDEPTSALNAVEAERLFLVIDRLKQQGCAIVYITHKLEEIKKLGDRITVLRDGRVIGTALAKQLDEATMIRWMVGRQLNQQFPARDTLGEKERLRVDNLVVRKGGPGGNPSVRGLSFTARSGEVVGIAGLQGSGASWVLQGLFDPMTAGATGSVWLDGELLRTKNPREAIRRGIALLTNDRKATGLVLSLSVIANATMADWPSLARWGWRRPNLERHETERLVQTLRIRAPSLDAEVSSLSGGNQQKVALAKWLKVTPRVLLLDEPTRGIDVGAKHEIYELIRRWTREGISIVLTTSELPELLALSHRILVLHRGSLTAELAAEEATPEKVLEAAMGRLLRSNIGRANSND